ncbi:hypothetical protein JMJ76_0007075 [Colletotrichum scovillei]|nr:hypothetical protein JMJ76_0007075 [Colletotrichum scovillei]
MLSRVPPHNVVGRRKGTSAAIAAAAPAPARRQNEPDLTQPAQRRLEARLARVDLHHISSPCSVLAHDHNQNHTSKPQPSAFDLGLDRESWPILPPYYQCPCISSRLDSFSYRLDLFSFWLGLLRPLPYNFQVGPSHRQDIDAESRGRSETPTPTQPDPTNGFSPSATPLVVSQPIDFLANLHTTRKTPSTAALDRVCTTSPTRCATSIDSLDVLSGRGRNLALRPKQNPTPSLYRDETKRRQCCKKLRHSSTLLVFGRW